MISLCLRWNLKSVVLVLAWATVACAGDAEHLGELLTERAELKRRLAEVDDQIDVEIRRLWAVRSLTFLGMTVVDPTPELVRQYALPEQVRNGPIIVRMTADAGAAWGFPPWEGCAFWLVEHPAKAFFFNEEHSPAYFPSTVQELLEAILACTVSPAEYQKIWDDTRNRSREYAKTLENKPVERERLLKVAEMKIPTEDAERYICRVVYHFPKTAEHDAGTMTTYLRMTKEEVDHLRDLLKK